MRAFVLQHIQDPKTKTIEVLAEGFQFTNGKVAVCWLETSGVVVYDNLDVLHGMFPEGLSIVWVRIPVVLDGRFGAAFRWPLV